LQYHLSHDELASERTLLAAKWTFSAWILTGFAGVGIGLAVVNLLVIWGASIFINAIIDNRRICAKLIQESQSKNSLLVFLLMTAVLLIVAALVFWITLQ